MQDHQKSKLLSLLMGKHPQRKTQRLDSHVTCYNTCYNAPLS